MVNRVRYERPGHRHPTRCGGLAYLGVLLLLALIALAASASLQAGTALARRDAEAHLLAIGREFQDALYSHANLPRGAAASPGLRGPRTLEELLRDPRVPGVRRHLRQVYADPLTGAREWGLVRDRDGYIVGIHSLADGRPVRQKGFDPALANFEDAEGYADWVFGFPAAVAAARAASSPSGREAGQKPGRVNH